MRRSDRGPKCRGGVMQPALAEAQCVMEKKEKERGGSAAAYASHPPLLPLPACRRQAGPQGRVRAAQAQR